MSAGSFAHTMRLINREILISITVYVLGKFFFSDADNWESDVFHLVEGGGRGQL